MTSNKRNKYIDCHNHIIPFVDDGSSSFEESIDMALSSIQSGAEAIFATPHLIVDKNTFKSIEKANLNIDKLKAELSNADIHLDIKLGFEIFLTENIIYNSVFPELCLGDSNCILVEIDPVAEADWIIEFIYEMNLKKIKVILAHTERFYDLLKSQSLLTPVKESGTLFQVSTASVTGYNGKHAYLAAKKLIKSGYIDLIGTDVHYSGHSGFEAVRAYKRITNWVGKEKASDIFYNNAKKYLLV